MPFILSGGTAAPPVVPPAFVDSSLVAPVLLFAFDPPAGYVHADVCKFVNQDQHLFVVWDDFDNMNSNMAVLYDVATGAIVYQQVVLGSISHDDIVWDAKTSDEWFYQRTANGATEISKWDITGRLWVSTRYDSLWNWCGGIAADGVRSVFGGRDTVAINGFETTLMEGVDETPTSQVIAGSTLYDICGAVSRDGLIYIVKPVGPGLMIHNLSTDTQVHVNATTQFTNFDMSLDVNPMVAIDATGASAIALDNVSNQAVLLTGGPAAYVETLVGLPNTPRGCAISADGTKAVVVSRPGSSGSSSGNGLTVTVFDMVTKTVQLDSAGLPVQYVVQNPTTAAHGNSRWVGITDDATQIGFGTFRNHGTTGIEYPSVFRASSTKRKWADVYQAPAGHVINCGDFAVSDGSLMAAGTRLAGGFPPTGIVALLSLP